ncbi:aldo/keto reductase [Actinacidiphila sp. DG2A-62]|uniref:aldo/keto reductase n=1 Tax=Actinacidiphila sp. DG2A-62 TaxID=3108821 RepID=UPI002DBF79F4|nr:aldo/keto reductase [Actinacidiphila sp. DG2A-62]MEC3995037.1 aldo/keto reductase [Actinacidiphila sp. DG2A-62]
MKPTLALGTYRIAGEHLTDAARRAASSPAAWIDTAPNYCYGRAHRLLAPALAEYPALRVATKVGYMDSARARVAEAAGVIDSRDAIARHSIGAAYVRWQTEDNRAALGRDCLDMLFLHNPERTARPGELWAELRDAFTVLEEEADAGHIAAYGIATWTGFSEGAFSVSVLDRLAREAAGSDTHHLRAIQLPVSLVMAEAFDMALRGTGPIVQAGWQGWEVHASAPLHGGELKALATPELAELIQPGASIPAACITAVANCPGLSKVLMSTGDPKHWAEALTAVDEPVAASALRKTLDVLATVE